MVKGSAKSIQTAERQEMANEIGANREGSTKNNFRNKEIPQYLCGRKFLLVTDNKPLTTLLGPKRGIPTLAAARLQTQALLLAVNMQQSNTVQLQSTQMPILYPVCQYTSTSWISESMKSNFSICYKLNLCH